MTDSVNISFSEIDISLPLIFKEMGYGETAPSQQIEKIAADLLAETASKTHPKCLYNFFDGSVEEQFVVLADGAKIHTGAVISNLLQGSERFAFFAATAGQEFHNFQKIIEADDDIVKSFIINTIGTCVVEAAGDFMERLLVQELSGVRHTARYSPGYCGWKLTGQKELFALLGDRPCGIELTDVCLMLPIKSISGVIGIGERVTENQYGCRFCELENCYKKKK